MLLALQGDSGFMLVREGKIVYRSPVLQHFFDCPLQFGAVPDFSESTDSAEDAAVAELQVELMCILDKRQALGCSLCIWLTCIGSPKPTCLDIKMLSPDIKQPRLLAVK